MIKSSYINCISLCASIICYEAQTLKQSATHYKLREPGSSGSIVSGYGLDDRAIEVRSPAEAKGFFSSLCVQTGSGVQPASCTMGTRGPFRGAKARPGRDADHSPHLVWRCREWVGAIPPPPSAFVACSRTALETMGMLKVSSMSLSGFIFDTHFKRAWLVSLYSMDAAAKLKSWQSH
jgi:hypothetical protein